MTEISIILEDINPISLLGVNNANLKVFAEQYPKTKIISRGNEIKLIGEPEEIREIQERLQALIDHLHKFGNLNESRFQELLQKHNEEQQDETLVSNADDILVYGNNGRIIRARTPNQRKMVEYSRDNDILFAIGPAGTGKTYTAVALAVKALKNKEIKRIILARPAVEAGESLGFLPGDLKEKIDPYLRPLYDALEDMIPAEKLKVYLENRTIEVAPMAFMRGRTLDNCFVILDEAQNATDLQLKMFLTRMGPSAKFIITGDLSQIDLPRRHMSGLLRAVKILNDIRGIRFAYLDVQDVVRHQLVKEIIKAYEVPEE